LFGIEFHSGPDILSLSGPDREGRATNIA
jgi:hypothetical protein